MEAQETEEWLPGDEGSKLLLQVMFGAWTAASCSFPEQTSLLMPWCVAEGLSLASVPFRS